LGLWKPENLNFSNQFSSHVHTVVHTQKLKPAKNEQPLSSAQPWPDIGVGRGSLRRIGPTIEARVWQVGGGCGGETVMPVNCEPPPHQLMGLGQRCKLPQQGMGWPQTLFGAWKSPKTAYNRYKFRYFHCTNLHSQLKFDGGSAVFYRSRRWLQHRSSVSDGRLAVTVNVLATDEEERPSSVDKDWWSLLRHKK